MDGSTLPQRQRSARGMGAGFRGFAAWLRQQRDRDDPVGDLSQDFIFDQNGTGPVRTFRALRFRMWEFHACKEAHETLNLARAEWRAARAAYRLWAGSVRP